LAASSRIILAKFNLRCQAAADNSTLSRTLSKGKLLTSLITCGTFARPTVMFQRGAPATLTALIAVAAPRLVTFSTLKLRGVCG